MPGNYTRNTWNTVNSKENERVGEKLAEKENED
jgi:hypothetical protein